ncbi:MAG: LysR family transcriptional regulator [Caulobacteraceae bacterium]|nr:LysR family transcriptional regulator [Caulobacteraceae bacterium]
MIDRYQLRYFLAVVEAGNFSRAAAKMNVTQPTLSAGIAKLEQSLATQLLFRNSRRVYLTDAGTRFLASAKAIELEFNKVERRSESQHGSPLVRLGFLTTIPTLVLEAIVEQHGSIVGGQRLEVVEGNERDLLGALDRERVDIALTMMRREPAKFPQEPLLEEGYSLALPIDHAFSRADAVDGQDLASETMIVRRNCEMLSATSRYFTDRGVRPEFSFRSNNDDRVLALVRSGLGITVMPDMYTDAKIARPRLVGFDHRRQVGLMYSQRRASLQYEECSVVSAIRIVLARKGSSSEGRRPTQA